MKKLTNFLPLCLLSWSLLCGQSPDQKSFHEIDQRARSLEIGRSTLEDFTKSKLTTGLKDDISKARAIYVWITENIAYDCRKYHEQNRTVRLNYSSEEDLQRKLAALEEKNLSRTLKYQRGICQDYTLLFNSMCSAVGIESKMINGFVPNGHRRIGQKPGTANHAWNVFKANGKWHLIDATWGSGFVNAGVTSFRKEFRNEFFMMPPEEMIKTHYPTESKWQLLNDPYDVKSYAAQPVFYPAYWKLGIQSISPSSGTIGNKNVVIQMRLPDTKFDEKKLAVVQGDKMLQYGFSKEGAIYKAVVSPRGSKNIIVMVQKSRTSFDPVIEYKP